MTARKKPRAPKPVKAPLKPTAILCRVSAPLGMQPWLAPHCSCEERGTAHPSEGRGAITLCPEYGERVIRAMIVPDGAPSAAAEVRRLRRACRRAVTLLTGTNDGLEITKAWETLIAALARQGRKSK